MQFYAVGYAGFGPDVNRTQPKRYAFKYSGGRNLDVRHIASGRAGTFVPGRESETRQRKGRLYAALELTLPVTGPGIQLRPSFFARPRLTLGA